MTTDGGYTVFGPNPFGIFAAHDITPLKTDFESMCNGPLKWAEPELKREIARPLNLHEFYGMESIT